MNTRDKLTVCELIRAARQFEKYPEPWQEPELRAFARTMFLIKERLEELPRSDMSRVRLTRELERLEGLKTEFEMKEGKVCR